MSGRAASFLANRWTRLALRLLLGAVFLWAGILKLQEPQLFADSIADYRILPESLINLVALSLPVLEILLGLLLVGGYEAELAALGSGILMTVFAVALVAAMARGLQVDCGCFGSGEASAWRMGLALGRNVLLGGMALALMVGGSGTPEAALPKAV